MLKTFFGNLDFKIEGNDLLREPQRDGYLKTREFFRAGKNKAILQVPVGCGKTGLAALLPPGLTDWLPSGFFTALLGLIWYEVKASETRLNKRIDELREDQKASEARQREDLQALRQEMNPIKE